MDLNTVGDSSTPPCPGRRLVQAPHHFVVSLLFRTGRQEEDDKESPWVLHGCLAWPNAFLFLSELQYTVISPGQMK